MYYSLVMFALLVLTGVLAYLFLQLRQSTIGGFLDWVKNPAYKQAAADYFAARESLKVSDNITDADIQNMVDRLFVKEDDDFNFHRMKLVGAKATPFLLEALRNPQTATTTFDGALAVEAKSPFERICDLLRPIAPPDAVPLLSSYVEHEDSHFRKVAALALGNIGEPDCVNPMLIALADDDDYVRSYAMMGIKRGIEANRRSQEFLDAVFPSLKALLKRHDSSVSREAPVLMLMINVERALPILLSPKYLSVENTKVSDIIRALNDAGHKIPHDRLLPFLETARPLAANYPFDNSYAAALKAYAANPDAAAEETFRAELKSSSTKVQQAAAEALATVAGVSNPREVVWEAHKQLGYDALSLPQKHYLSVFMYDAEVRNGGHSQYFVNSFGERWRDALDGLKAIKAHSRASILEEATRLFGQEGPSTENETRHREIAAFVSSKKRAIKELDSKYYACDENIEALLAQFAMANQEHFRRK